MFELMDACSMRDQCGLYRREEVDFHFSMAKSMVFPIHQVNSMRGPDRNLKADPSMDTRG